MGLKWGKRMVFPEKSLNDNKQELLQSYLTAMRDKEKEKFDKKNQKI